LTWPATIFTLYPEIFPGPLGHSIARWTTRRPGGGAGMAMRADVLAAAVDEVLARRPEAPLLAMSPRGAPLTQALVRALAQGPG